MQLSQYFSLMDTQARMALRGDASRLFMGYFWWILEPLLYVAVFYVVFSLILDNGRADFLVFLVCGKMTFIWFSKTVNLASNSIVGNKGLIGKLDVPKSLFPLSVIQASCYRQLAVFVLLFAVLLINGYPVSSTWVWLIPVIVVNYLMIVACSLIGAYLVCLVRDFSMLISLSMIFLMFTSGIFWDVRQLPDPQMTEFMLAFNPLAFLLDAYRQILMYQTPPDLIQLGKFGILFVAVVFVMTQFMRRSSKYLALKALTA
jgi:homopolymeric O-antigen transport system permease protein